MKFSHCSKVRGSEVIFHIEIRLRSRSGMMRFVIHRLNCPNLYVYLLQNIIKF